jgi:hypothetical protein
MGLLDFLFGKPIKLDNKFFGTMLFIKDKKNWYVLNDTLVPVTQLQFDYYTKADLEPYKK